MQVVASARWKRTELECPMGGHAEKRAAMPLHMHSAPLES